MAKPGRKIRPRSSLTLGSDEDRELYCQPCDQNSPRLPAVGYCLECAEHLCRSCFNSHKKAKPCRNHTLLDRDAMPKSLQFSATVYGSASTDSLTKLCPKHRKEIIKFFCHDHNALLCAVCGMQEHRSCEVKYIPDIAGQSVNKEFKEAVEHMDKILSKCQRIKRIFRREIKESNRSLQDILSELKTLRQQINQAFDEYEKKLHDAGELLDEENEMKFQTTEEDCDKIARSVQELSHSIHQLNNTGKVERLFVELKSAEHAITTHNSTLRKLRKNTYTKKYTFETGHHIELSEFVRHIGTYFVLVLKPFDSICVHPYDDEEEIEGSIRKMVLLNNHLILLQSDCDYSCIKMVDVNNKTVISAATLPKEPYDITVVTNDEVAITIPTMKTIQFISTAANKLTLTHSFQVKGPCSGISCYHDKLVVTSKYSRKLEILDKTGTVLSSVTTDYSDDENDHAVGFLFDDDSSSDEGDVTRDSSHASCSFSEGGTRLTTSSVWCNSNGIFVFDHGSNEVKILNWQGKVIGKYRNFGNLEALAQQGNGTVLGYDREKCNVIQLSSDCRKRKAVLLGVNSLNAMCCDDEHKLYASESFDSYINVYRF